jgi:N-acetylmuramoyl-L-alanine amidase
MPAVLLELGFITNPSDLSVLKSQQGREDISDKLLAAFSSYKAYYDSSIDAVKQAVKPETVQDVTEKTPEVDSGTYYGIQIFGLKKLLKAGDPAFKGLDVHSVVTPGSEVVRYVSGRWGSASKAVDNLDAVRRKFPDAYVVKVSDGVVSRVK